jgi:hypothetical protein
VLLRVARTDVQENFSDADAQFTNNLTGGVTMDIRRSRGVLLGAGLLAVALAGATGIALAQSSNGSKPPPVRELDDTSPGKSSSVTVAPSQPGTETDEGTALQGLAKITPDQAKAAAVAVVPGNATKVELENEDGNVVYAVEVTGTDGKQTDLKIDAGNGAVLSKESESGDSQSVDEAPENPGADGAKEAPEKPETNEQDQADEIPEVPEAPEAPGD